MREPADLSPSRPSLSAAAGAGRASVGAILVGLGLFGLLVAFVGPIRPVTRPPASHRWAAGEKVYCGEYDDVNTCLFQVR